MKKNFKASEKTAKIDKKRAKKIKIYKKIPH